MLTKIDKAKEKLEEAKKKMQAKIKSKEEILRSKEKKQQFNQLVEIGKIAQKANISDIDRLALLGAFLEISQVKENNEKLESWRQKGAILEEKNSKNETMPLTVKFESEPTENALKKIKELKFKWNRFRKEFYGYGCKTEMAEAFKNESCLIEEIK